MIRTNAFQVDFLSWLTIVNEGLSLTIVNETTNFIKTIVLKTTIFKTIVSISIFRLRFHYETIVFLKNENVNIPSRRPVISGSNNQSYKKFTSLGCINKVKNIKAKVQGKYLQFFSLCIIPRVSNLNSMAQNCAESCGLAWNCAELC